MLRATRVCLAVRHPRLSFDADTVDAGLTIFEEALTEAEGTG
jgi:hypothetical protein